MTTLAIPFEDEGAPRLLAARRMLWVVAALLVTALGWAWFAALDEVATGTGRVVPTSHEQVIQSLEGGILARLAVRQDDIVRPGQLLAQLDPTQAGSTVEESAAKYRAALASQARLQAEVNGTPLRFSPELDRYPELKAEQQRLYAARRASLNGSVGLIDESLALIGREVGIGESLIAVGAASNVEVLRLKRQRADLDLKKSDLRSQYMVEARQDLAKVSEEVEALAPVVRGRSDTLQRLTLRSPVRGVVKNIEVSTRRPVADRSARLATRYRLHPPRPACERQDYRLRLCDLRRTGRSGQQHLARHDPRRGQSRNLLLSRLRSHTVGRAGQQDGTPFPDRPRHDRHRRHPHRVEDGTPISPETAKSRPRGDARTMRNFIIIYRNGLVTFRLLAGG
jgi:multidrug resistance efflux pump